MSSFRGGRRAVHTLGRVAVIMAAMALGGCGDDFNGVSGNRFCSRCAIVGTGTSDWALALAVNAEFTGGEVSNPRLEVLWDNAPGAEFGYCLYAGVESGFTTPPSRWDDLPLVADVINRDAPINEACPLSDMPDFEALEFRLVFETTFTSTTIRLEKAVGDS